ncbi:MAG TPA: ATP-binding cassette domain-containing protein [Actinopolymorphaceae bacterium]|nr:ATP-binding cassette domain-containing protein [Actinopolymorphaceae bacterium]
MRLIDLHARYSRRTPWVLRGIDVELRPGDTVVVQGRNGAGKSTLLRVLAGLLPVRRRGEVSGRPEVVGWLPERFPTRMPFTVGSYLLAMAAVHGIPAAQARSRIDGLADRLHFQAFLSTRLGSLSQGTGRKVGLTQALLRPPGLLVMDEPWEGLDAPSQAEIPALVGEVTTAGGTCVLSDHRGRAADLNGPLRTWQVVDGQLYEDDPEPTEPEPVSGDDGHAGRQVIEVVVKAAESTSVVASLRAAGYDVRAVRSDQ